MCLHWVASLRDCCFNSSADFGTKYANHHINNQPEAMTTSSEDVLLQIGEVRYKKGDGTLYIMNERIAWMLENRDKVVVSHMYQDIKSTTSSCTHTHTSDCLQCPCPKSSAKDLTGGQTQSAAAGGSARWHQHHIPLCQQERPGGHDCRPRQNQGATTAAAAQL